VIPKRLGGYLFGVVLFILCAGCCTSDLWHVENSPGSGVMKPEVLKTYFAHWTTNDVLELEYKATWPIMPWFVNGNEKRILRVSRQQLMRSPHDPMGVRPDNPDERPLDLRIDPPPDASTNSIPFLFVDTKNTPQTTIPWPDYECVLVHAFGTDTIVGHDTATAAVRFFNYPPGALTWFKPGTTNTPGYRVTLIQTQPVRPTGSYIATGFMTPFTLVVDLVTLPVQAIVLL